jgi:hypothetical protein
VDLDRIWFELENPGRMDYLGTDRDVYSSLDGFLTTTAIIRNNGNADLRGLKLSFRILTPDSALYLKKTGAWDTYTGSNSETTWDVAGIRLNPSESDSIVWSVAGITWPEGGTYHLEVWWDTSCGNAIGTDSALFRVVDDSDGDGLRDDVEVGNGLDPYDRDTDDDGILDAEDGLGDADGDTVKDGAECDADADTLPDSVEMGLDGTGLDPDTDLGAGCFRPDGDAGATTTDRLDPDSDNGGEADGLEDVDGDGTVGPGEKDPLDESDDPCAWSAPPEASGLTVSRVGADLFLDWTDMAPVDPCVTYAVWAAGGVDDMRQGLFAELASGLLWPSLQHGGAAGGVAMRFYLVSATGRIGGDGPLGHFSQ